MIQFSSGSTTQIIIDQNGIIRYTCYSETAGDHPTFDELLHHARMLQT